jgi:hypothetical protein
MMDLAKNGGQRSFAWTSGCIVGYSERAVADYSCEVGVTETRTRNALGSFPAGRRVFSRSAARLPISGE